jgi:glycosyltransferase involved in cell wall biosynthesis
MIDGRPLVSVVVPTFNRAKVLRDALDSIARQDVSNVETIVVDDGSTDDTEAVVASCGHAVQYVRQPHRGAAAARNTGVAHATGRFIAFLDSDDVWLPGKMHAELAVFEANSGVDAVISDSERWREHELVCTSWLADRGLVVFGDEPLPLEPIPHLKAGKIFATCSLTIRREALDRIGHPPFDTSLETHEDMDFAVRMYHCCSIMVLPRTLSRVRRFSDGTRDGRPLPGTDYPPPLKVVMARRKYRIYEKALRLPAWPDGAVPHIRAARRLAAREFADNLRGWRRGSLVSMVMAELRYADIGSALVIAIRGLVPDWARPRLAAVATTRMAAKATPSAGGVS